MGWSLADRSTRARPRSTSRGGGVAPKRRFRLGRRKRGGLRTRLEGAPERRRLATLGATWSLHGAPRPVRDERARRAARPQREESARPTREARPRGGTGGGGFRRGVRAARGRPSSRSSRRGREGGSPRKKKASSSSGVKKSASARRRAGITLAAEEGAGRAVRAFLLGASSDKKAFFAPSLPRGGSPPRTSYLLTYLRVDRSRTRALRRAGGLWRSARRRVGSPLSAPSALRPRSANPSPGPRVVASALDAHALAAMISTHVDRASARASRTRRAAARLVARLAGASGGRLKAPPQCAAGGRRAPRRTPTGSASACFPLVVPRDGWPFCDDPADPARSDREAWRSRPSVCPHGLGLRPARGIARRCAVAAPRGA